MHTFSKYFLIKVSSMSVHCQSVIMTVQNWNLLELGHVLSWRKAPWTYRLSQKKVQPTLIPYNSGTLDRPRMLLISFFTKYISTHTGEIPAYYIFQILLLNRRHPLLKLHRYWIMGNRSQVMHTLNVRYFKIYESMQTLQKQFY